MCRWNTRTRYNSYNLNCSTIDFLGSKPDQSKTKTEPQTSGGAPSGVRVGASPAPEQLRLQREAFLNKLGSETSEK